MRSCARPSGPTTASFEDEKLYLLPVKGSDTQGYRNILKDPSIRIDAQSESGRFRAPPTREAEAIKSVVGKFREKYEAGLEKKYYSKFDVAVLAEYLKPQGSR